MDTGIGREKGRKKSNTSVGFKEVFKSFIHSFTQQIPTEPLLCFLNIPGSRDTKQDPCSHQV